MLFRKKFIPAILALVLLILGSVFFLGAIADKEPCEIKGGATGQVYSAYYTSGTEAENANVTMGDTGYILNGDAEYETLDMLLSSLNPGGCVFFDNIVTKGFSVSCDITISGSLTVTEGNITEEGGNLRLDNLSLVFNNGSLRVKGGSSSLVSGSIYSKDKPAVLLDYSAQSRFSMTGGSVKSEKEAAIKSLIGTLDISGGEISSLYSDGIYNASSLYIYSSPKISGFDYDIVTQSPPHVSYNGTVLSQNVKIKYLAEFKKGTITTVLHSGTALNKDNVTLFDKNGEKYELTFFESSQYTDEKNFFAVYLPYTASFYAQGEEYISLEFLEGEALKRPEDPWEFGYVFGGWYSDHTLSSPYEFGTAEPGDISLFAAFSLEAPTFSISSLDFSYDKSTHYLTFENISHPLSKEGSFSYEWYKNNEPITAIGDKVAVMNVSDSGAYKCKLTFTYNGEYVSVTTPNINVNISKCKIEIPEILPVEYTGLHQNISSLKNSAYSVFSEGGTNAGSYPVILTLYDTDNYCFDNREGDSITLDFVILSAQNEFMGNITVPEAYPNKEPVISPQVKFGTPKIEYSKGQGGPWSTVYPAAVGKYYLRISVEASENYSGLVSQIYELVISDDVCIGITLASPPEKLSYIAFETLSLEGLCIIAEYNSGRSEVLSNDNIAVEYRSGTCLHAQDNSVVIKYKEHSLPLEVSVSAAEYDLSGVVFSDTTLKYSGHRYTIDCVCNVVGLDGVALEFTVRGGGTDAGSYEVTLEFVSRSLNYKAPEPITRALVIEPMEISAVYENLTFVYDGEIKAPQGYIIGVNGAEIPLEISGGAVSAGKYTAYARCENKNYTLINPKTSFEIQKASYDISDVVWSNSNFSYTGESHSVTLLGLPAGVSVIGYVDATATDAGEYSALVLLKYDDKNYNEIEIPPYKWSISKGDYDMSGVVFLNSVYTFDGEYHTPTMQGVLPVGQDGSIPEVSFSSSIRDVTFGVREVIISFKSQSENYNDPKSVTATVKILPKEITVNWITGELVYNGKKQCPTAEAAECGLNIFGGGVDAGNYIATCQPTDTNYSVINSTIAFTIGKCDNKWVSQVGILGGFEGDTPAPFGSAMYGQVLFEYFLLPGGEPISPPTVPGEYYLRPRVSEGENYKELVGNYIPFTVSKILPVRLMAVCNVNGFSAFDVIDASDISVYYINNNGSHTNIDFYTLEIIYSKASSLRYGDNSVRLKIGEFEYTLPISVDRAVYDMSAVVWQGLHHVYDGGEKFASLTGLPYGVSVSRYNGNGGIVAGEYTITAELVYDSENYYPPSQTVAVMKIEKCKIPYPKLPDFVYDGKEKSYTVFDTEYYLGGAVSGTAAGKYSLELKLRDPKNYEFSGVENYVYLSIAKRELTLKVEDNRKSYTVVSGNIVEGDRLNEKYYETEGGVYISIDNPNYSLTVIPSAVKPGNQNLWLILLFILIGIILFLGIYIVYVRWDRLLLPVGGLKTKARGAEETAPVIKNSTTTPLPENALLSVDEMYADTLITDNMAKSLVEKQEKRSVTAGKSKVSVNIGEISAVFNRGDAVDINAMKAYGVISKDAAYVKVLGGGVIDKPLTVYADNFSLGAVKMIALTGGKAVKSKTVVKRHNKKYR